MIDIHSHILYGLDDGARTKEDMFNMAKQAVADGITVMTATPHHRDGRYHNPAETVLKRVQEANQDLQEAGIALRIVPGMEVHIHGELLDNLNQGEVLTYNQQKRYVLLELPHDHVPKYLDQLLYNLQLAGYLAIIAHPERNRQIRERPNLLYHLVRRGALAQLTAASVAGKFGKKIQKACFDLIDHHLIHFIASDAHNIDNRAVCLSEAYQVVEKKFGDDYAQVFQYSAERMIQGHDIELLEPESFKKKLFGLF